MVAKIVYNRTALALREKRLVKAQKYIDKECIKRMGPYVPVGLPRFVNSGKLKASATIAEPGVIVYTAPFSRKDYYADVNHAHGGNPQARRMWFEVMKAESVRPLLKGVAKIMGCKYRI